MKKSFNSTTMSLTGRKCQSRQGRMHSANQVRTEPDCIVSQIRTRHLEIPGKVTPQLASQVVKEYILPLFKYEGQRKADKKRTKDFGNHHQRHLSVVSGTALAELKLSEQLLNELEEAKKQLASACKYSKDTEQEKFAIEKELKKCKEQIQENTTNLRFLHEENLKLQDENGKLNGMKMLLFTQIFTYKNMFEGASKNFNELSKEFHDEKANNDIRLKNL